MKGTSYLGIAALSPRELEVLRLAAEGLTDSSICHNLSIAPGTLGTYWVRIRNKTGLTSRAELAAAHARHLLEAILVRTVSVVAESTLPYGQNRGVQVGDVFDTLPIAAIVVRADGTFVNHNRMASHVLGRTLVTRASIFGHLVTRDVQMFGHLLRAAGNGDSEVRFASSVQTSSGAKTCHWIARRLSQDNSHVLLIVSEADSPTMAVVMAED